MYPGNTYNNSFMYWMGVIRIEFESSVRLEFDSNFVIFKSLPVLVGLDSDGEAVGSPSFKTENSNPPSAACE